MLRRVPWAAISLIGFTTSAWMLNSGCQANDAGNFNLAPPSTVAAQGGTSASEGTGGSTTENTRPKATATGPTGGAASASNPKSQGGSTSKSAAQGEGGEDATGGSTKGGTTAKASTTKGGSTSKSSTTAAAKGGTKAASTTEEEPTTTEQTCTDDLMTLASGEKFNWIVNTSGKSCGVQGAIYAYGDGEGSLTSPAEAGSDWETPCVEDADAGGVKCCVSGTTVADDTYAAWGFAIGLDLNATSAGKKSGYAGDAKGFTIKISVGKLASGQEVRIGYKQKTTDAVSPFVGGKGGVSTTKITGSSATFDVLFTDVSCPDAEWGTCTKPTSAPIGLEIQLSGTGTDETKVGATTDFCITSIVPIL